MKLKNNENEEQKAYICASYITLNVTIMKQNRCIWIISKPLTSRIFRLCMSIYSLWVSIIELNKSIAYLNRIGQFYTNIHHYETKK